MNGRWKIVDNNGCYKITFISYQTRFNIGAIKIDGRLIISKALLLNVTWQMFSVAGLLILTGSGLKTVDSIEPNAA